MGTVSRQDQREIRRDADWAGNPKCGTVVRYVADGAVDDPPPNSIVSGFNTDAWPRPAFRQHRNLQRYSPMNSDKPTDVHQHGYDDIGIASRVHALIREEEATGRDYCCTESLHGNCLLLQRSLRLKK
jgi:hypothetical protein